MSDIPSNPYADTTGWIGLPPSSDDVAATAKQQEQGWKPVEEPGIVEKAVNFIKGHRQYEYPEIGPSFRQKASDLMPTTKGGQDVPPSAEAQSSSELATELPVDKQRLMKSYQNVGNGMDVTTDIPGQVDIIRKNFPKARFTSDTFGNVVANVDGERYYLNPKGLSHTDLNTAIHSIALAAIPGIGLARGGAAIAGAAGRVLGGGLGVAAGDLARQAEARNYGSETPINLKEALGTGAIAAGTEILTPMAYQAVKNLFSNPTYFDPATRALTPQGTDLLRQAGVDPAQISPDVAQKFFEISKGSFYPVADKAAVLRQAQAQTLPEPVTLTTGQASKGDDLLKEFTISGESARGRLSSNLQLQNEQLRKNAEQIQAQIGGGASNVSSSGEGARDAQANLVQQRDALKLQTDTAYDDVRRASNTFPTGPVIVPDKSLATLSTNMNGVLSTFDPKIIPKAQAVIDDLPNPSSGPIRSSRGTFIPKGVDLTDLERWRTRAIKTQETLPAGDVEQKLAIGRIIDTYDTHLETSVKSDLLHGSPDVIDQWTAARGLKSRYNDIFQKDDLIRELTGNGKLVVDPSEAANYIFGRGQLGATNNLTQNMRSLKDTLPPEEWSKIREEGFLRLMRGQDPTTAFNGTMYSRNLQNAIDKSPGAMNILYTPEERTLMKQFGNVAKDVNQQPSMSQLLVPPLSHRLVAGLGHLGPLALGYVKVFTDPALTRGLNPVIASKAITGALPTTSPVPAGVGAAIGAAASPLVPNMMPTWLGGRY